MSPKTRQVAACEHNLRSIQIEELHKEIEKLRLQVKERARRVLAQVGSAEPHLDDEEVLEGDDFKFENPFHNLVLNRGRHGREEWCP